MREFTGSVVRTGVLVEVLVGPAGSGVDAGAAETLVEVGNVSDNAVGVIEGGELGAEAPTSPHASPEQGATGVGGSKIPNSPPLLRPQICQAPLVSY